MIDSFSIHEDLRHHLQDVEGVLEKVAFCATQVSRAYYRNNADCLDSKEYQRLILTEVGQLLDSIVPPDIRSIMGPKFVIGKSVLLEVDWDRRLVMFGASTIH